MSEAQAAADARVRVALEEARKRVQPLLDRLKLAERWSPEMRAFRFGPCPFRPRKD